jgi:hypothetical protein
MQSKIRNIALIALASVAAPAILLGTSHASDHADTPDIASNPGTDITDVHLFPSPNSPDRVVLAMSVHPLIAPGSGTTTAFDPNVLYQFKIDNSGDGIEDLVIQARFSGSDPATQKVMISAPVKPHMTGSLSKQVNMYPVKGTINAGFSPAKEINVFAGGREDAFFFDLEQFFNIFPDRATPLGGPAPGSPNQPQQTTWRAQGVAQDFLSTGQYNVLSIVVEVPRNLLTGRNVRNPRGPGSKVIGVWCTTSVPTGNIWRQMDRLARPAINELFATVANDQHKQNDEISPSQDKAYLKPEINNFMVNVAGRSQAIANVVTAVTVPDVLKADLSSFDQASYLGYETGGATGGKFGGRALGNDVIDISLGIVFGNVIPSLGLAPDDGNEIPTLTSDHVDASGKHFLSTFPYLGNPG